MEKSDFSSLDSCVFTSNTALNGSGGALYVTISSNISISNAVFFNNTAFSGGGAVFWDKSGYTEKNSSYEGNTANFGSDYASSPARISVEYLGSDPVVNSFFHDSVTVYIWDQYDQVFVNFAVGNGDFFCGHSSFNCQNNNCHKKPRTNRLEHFVSCYFCTNEDSYQRMTLFFYYFNNSVVVYKHNRSNCKCNS